MIPCWLLALKKLIVSGCESYHWKGKPTDMLDVMPRLKDDDEVKQCINIAEFVQAELFSLGLSDQRPFQLNAPFLGYVLLVVQPIFAVRCESEMSRFGIAWSRASSRLTVFPPFYRGPPFFNRGLTVDVSF